MCMFSWGMKPGNGGFFRLTVQGGGGSQMHQFFHPEGNSRVEPEREALWDPKQAGSLASPCNKEGFVLR